MSVKDLNLKPSLFLHSTCSVVVPLLFMQSLPIKQNDWLSGRSKHMEQAPVSTL